MRILTGSLILFAAVTQAFAADAVPPAPASKAETLLTEPLPPMTGKEVLMLTVDLPPGGASPPHRHNANVYVYVLEGTLVMKTQNGPEVTLVPGQHFVEKPNEIHMVSRNPSTSAHAKFLVFMIKDAGAPTTVPVKM
jgi:quercetin dioxygenase-like cupin family protein